MTAKKYSSIKNALRYKFTKEHPPKADGSTEYFPSVLAITADVIDTSIKLKGKADCEIGIAECGVHENCEEEFDCKNKNRIFYIYRKEQLLVLEKPESLDANLRIDNHYPADGGNPVAELYEKGSRVLAFQVLYWYYETISWNKCYWNMDYYEEILATIFLFCPKILRYAIHNEMNADKRDMHIAKAIKVCLEFSIRLDKRIPGEEKKKTPKEKKDFYITVLVEIKGFSIMKDLEAALTKEFAPVSEVSDIVKMAMEVCSNVVDETKKILFIWSEEKDTQRDKRKYMRDLKKLLGNDNYNYLYGDRAYGK